MTITYDSENLKVNIRVLFTILWMTAREAAECLLVLDRLDNDLVDDFEGCREKGLLIFKIDELAV